MPENYEIPLQVISSENTAAATPLNQSDDEDIFASDKDKITELARELSRVSTRHSFTNQTEAFPPDSIYDPFSPDFNVTAWTKRLVSITQSDPEKYATRSAGVALKDLNVHGYGYDSGYQSTVGNVFWSTLMQLKSTVFGTGKHKVDIIKGFNGLLEAGDMLVVLGPPGSGCSTLLKTISGDVHGIYIDEQSEINYQGISRKQMSKNFRGEAIYTAEQDIHFPSLTVGDTLSFAAYARSHKSPPPGLTRRQFSTHMRDVVMAMLGISHTLNTKVGNEFVRGVSGGERKRVSIAEAMLAGAPLQCWDNSTRGLDAANAVEFCRNLRISTKYTSSTACVAIYQSPQAAYDCFSKVTVLYEGYQIYFGPTTAAKDFFVEMGFDCPEQQSTPDFLTSLTSPEERFARPGFESKVPRTPLEFHQKWTASDTYKQLKEDIELYNTKRYPLHGEHYKKFLTSRRAQQSRNTNPKSPYTLSYLEQCALCLERGFWRLKADPSLTLTQLIGNGIMSLLIASVFYNLPQTTETFFRRAGLLFFAVLMNAFGSALEILILYAQRPIVEKHERYAFYRPSAEAFASMLTDMPYKIFNCVLTNIIMYFMSNLRREAGPFFFFVFISFLAMMCMSSFFRSVAAMSRSMEQAMTPAVILILGLVLYTGFALPPTYMLGWISWFKYLNPIYFAFESLMVNEFAGRQYTCSSYVPTGPGYGEADPAVCTAVGSVPGQAWVDGTTYIKLAYSYEVSHRWRNVGILCAFMVGLTGLYLGATESIKAQKSKGEVIIFPRGKGQSKQDEESKLTSTKSRKAQAPAAALQKQTAIFSWQNLCYEIEIKGERRRILDHVDGWVKPGTLTALMGVSGAGKTTLLDVLATRVTMGVVSGEMLIDGRPRDASFQRKTGYCQQQDVHLATATVRESLEFSALLRQPAKYTKQERLDYVDEVLRMLDMESYQDAVVGALGEGLNVEQRKRLTIGVELVARPELLFFVDEPTSGLDSQTSWSILNLLEKLSQSGQAVLCTIHQPSAMLFSRFDRLLFLAKGGRTVYFDEVGENAGKLIEYFEKNGGPKYPTGANPAEWMLEVIGAAPGSKTEIDWHQTWLDSPECAGVRLELDRLKREGENKKVDASTNPEDYAEFSVGFGTQMVQVLKRVFQQLWRSPGYIYSKLLLVSAVGLFIGFSLYNTPNTIQGFQNQLFSIFLLMIAFGQLLEQILPHFIKQRDIYEVRERPAKIYSWKVFMLSNILVELPWNSLAGVLLFLTWYYPIGLYRNAQLTDTVAERGALMCLMVWTFLMFTSTFAHMSVAAAPNAEVAANMANLAFMMCLLFCGVMVPKSQLGWWIWMYYLSPFTYLVSGMLTAGVSNSKVVCSDVELVHFEPRNGLTCGEYMAEYISTAGGKLIDDNAISACSFCQVDDTNVLLSMFGIGSNTGWRSFGIMMIFIVFNATVAVLLYYWVRVPKKAKIETQVDDDVKSIADDPSRD